MMPLPAIIRKAGSAIERVTPDWLKELPFNAAQAAASTAGQALLLVERVRRELRGEQPPRPAATPPVPPAPKEPAATQSPARPPAVRVAKPVTAPARPPGPATIIEERPAPAGEPLPGREEAALPVPNYDRLTLASLRARLRNLSVAEVRSLLDYERRHAARPEVVGMYERRIARLEAEGGGRGSKA